MDYRFIVGAGTVVVWAAVTVLAVRRYGNRAAAMLGVCVMILAIAMATRTWLLEPPDLHFTNPGLTRPLDWWAHLTLAVVQVAFPAGLAIVLAILFAHHHIPTLVAVSSTAVFVGLMMAAGVFLSLIPIALFYHDGP